MSSLLRLLLVFLLVVIVGLGAYSKYSRYLESSHLAAQKEILAEQKILTQYEKILSDLADAKAKNNKTSHDIWLIGHLEKTRLHLEKYLPHTDDSSFQLSKLLSVNLVIIENIFMFSLMALGAFYYIFKGRILKQSYPLTPGLKQVHYRQQPIDSVAKKTYWLPMKPGGTNFQTHRLLTLSEDTLLLKSSGQVKAFFTVFVLIGINGMVFSLLKYLKREGLEAPISNPLPMIESLMSTGLVFVIVGILFGSMFGSLNTRFDKKTDLLSNKGMSLMLFKKMEREST